MSEHYRKLAMLRLMTSCWHITILRQIASGWVAIPKDLRRPALGLKGHLPRLTKEEWDHVNVKSYEQHLLIAHSAKPAEGIED